MRQVRKLFRFVKPYWKQVLLALVFLLGMVLMDLAIPRLTQRIIDQGIAPRDLRVVVQTFFLMLGISIGDTLFAVGNNNFSILVGEGMARDLRRALFLKIQSFSFGNLDRYKTGQLMVRLTSDSGVFQRLVHISLRVGTRAPLLMIGSIILMFVTNPQLASIMLPLLLVTLLAITYFVARMGPLFLAMLHELDKLNSVLQENIAGVRVVKAFVRAAHEARKFGEANQDYTDRNVRVMELMAAMGPSLSLCVNIGIVVVVWVGGLDAVHGSLSTGQLVAFVSYLLAIVAPLTSMVNLANIWAAAIVSAGRINEVLDEVPEVQDAPGAPTLAVPINPRVVFENVGFHYPGASVEMVLEGINLAAEPGTTVAVLGATGSGKTTLVNLVPRFYDVVQGRVLVGGLDIRKVRQDSLLGQVGIVPQESVLFSGSVRLNISYGRPEASDEEVVAAAKAAQAHDFIMELPKGYDTHVEERGVNLSGGQRQRIAIARALLTGPAILILDDSTSSVDVETETRIQAAIAEWMHGRDGPASRRHTCIVVAQRISTVLKADKIIVMERGRIVAEGTHRELMVSSPVYQDIFASQLGSLAGGG